MKGLLAVVLTVLVMYEGNVMYLWNTGSSLEYCTVVFFNGSYDRVYLRPGEESRRYLAKNVDDVDCFKG